MSKGHFGFVCTYFVPNALMTSAETDIYTLHGYIILSFCEASHFPSRPPGHAHTWLNTETEIHSSADWNRSSWGRGSECAPCAWFKQHSQAQHGQLTIWTEMCLSSLQHTSYRCLHLFYQAALSETAHLVSTSKFCSLHNPSASTWQKTNSVFHSFQLLTLQSFRHCRGEGTYEPVHMGILTESDPVVCFSTHPCLDHCTWWGFYGWFFLCLFVF